MIFMSAWFSMYFQLYSIVITMTGYIGDHSLITTMMVFRILESVPSARYSSISNVLRQLSTSVFPTYRVYQFYYIYMYIQKVQCNMIICIASRSAITVFNTNIHITLCTTFSPLFCHLLVLILLISPLLRFEGLYICQWRHHVLILLWTTVCGYQNCG